MSRQLNEHINRIWNAAIAKGERDLEPMATRGTAILIDGAKRGDVVAWAVLEEISELYHLVRLRVKSETRRKRGGPRPAPEERPEPREQARRMEGRATIRRGRTVITVPAIPGLEDHYVFDNIRYETRLLPRPKTIQLLDRQEGQLNGHAANFKLLKEAVDIAEIAWAKDKKLLFGEAYNRGKEIRGGEARRA